MAERTTGEMMEQRFLEAFLSPDSPSRGDKMQSAVNAGFSHSRAVRNANRILSERGVVDPEATPTPTPQGESLIKCIPKSEAPPKSSWWVGWNPLRVTPEERYAASEARREVVSGQSRRPASSSGATSPSAAKSASVGTDDTIPPNYVRTGNGSLLDRAFCDPPGGSGIVDWANDPRTMASNAFAASYARPREPKLSDFPGQLGCDRWDAVPVRDDVAVNDGKFHFYDEYMGDVTGDVVNDPNRQALRPGEAVQAVFHIPIRRQ